MLVEGYFHTFSSLVAASVVGIDNDREGQPVWLPAYSSSTAKFYNNLIFSTEAITFTFSYYNVYYNVKLCKQLFGKQKQKKFRQVVKTLKTTQLHGKRLTSLNEH
jgi:hypothetical protein